MIRKKLLAIIATTILTLSAGSVILAAEDTFINEDQAYKTAINFISSNVSSEVTADEGGDLYNHGYTTVSEEGYPSEFAISEIQPLYDENDNISAYNIKVIKKDRDRCGYVIVSANKEEYPIIEYSFDGSFYMETAADMIAENKGITRSSSAQSDIYYLGGLCYATDVDDKTYAIIDNGYTQVDDLSKLALNVALKTDNQSVVENEWKALSGNESEASNPPIGSFITVPDNYESGYSNKTSDYCVGMGSTYFEMTEFSSGGVCTPTAGTNLCLYWTRRNSSYNNLKNGTWQKTFDRIFTLMGTSKSNGTTWPSPARTGILNYFKERGLTNTEAYYSECTSTTNFNDYIKSEINVGRPVLIALWNDSKYGNHTVLGLGYTRYMYNGVWSSHYIRIADGWNTSVNRYVNYETGHSSITRIRVIPG